MKLSVSKNKQIIKTIDLSVEAEGVGRDQTIYIIGRSPSALIHLDDKQISREHAKLIYSNFQWSIECLTDKEIILNSKKIHTSELSDGDVIEIENFGIAVDLPEQKAKLPTKDFAHSSTNSDFKEKEKPNEGFDIDLDVLEDTSFFQNPKAAETSKKVAEVNENARNKQEDLKKLNANPNQNVKKEEEHLESLSDDLLEEQPAQEHKQDKSRSFSVVEERATSEFQNEDANDFLDLDPVIESNQESSEDQNNNDLGSLDDLAGSSDVVSADTNYSLDNLDESNEDGTKVMQSFASIELVLFGENAPYDRFRLEDSETFIGRDPKKCQIVLNDTEVSGVHAVIRKTNVSCILEDLNSSNGTLVNGERINKVSLNNNDEFLIGGVSFTVKYKSDFLKQEHQSLLPVDTDEEIEVEEVVEVPSGDGESLDAFGQEMSQAPQEKSIIKRIIKDEQTRKKALYVLVALVAAWLLLDEPAKVEEKKPTDKKEKVKDAVEDGKPKPPVSKKQLTEEQRAQLTRYYQSGRKHFLEGRCREAIEEFEKVVRVDPHFNDSVGSQYALSKDCLKKIEEKERQKQKEIEDAQRKIKIEELLKDAREYVKERRIEMAEARFNEIIQLDPDNIEVPRLKLDIENWKKEIARKELEEAEKKSARASKVQKLQPGKALFAQKEWFKAIGELEKFLKIEDMDDDLRKEGETMFDTSKTELASTVNPLLGKARSLLEGQDLKGAYETYYQILRYDPSNVEALNQTTDIKDQLTNKARKIYREAIISESLSLFQDAKEKFQEVQQISPVDSDYYKKATDKLKNYMD